MLMIRIIKTETTAILLDMTIILVGDGNDKYDNSVDDDNMIILFTKIIFTC